MKATFNIDETVMKRLKHEAARQRRTMSELAESALRRMFQSSQKKQYSPQLPTFHGGRELVDMADRNALYEAMENKK